MRAVYGSEPPPISIIVFEAPPLFIRAELPAATKIAAVFITFPTLFFKYSNAFA